MSLKYISPPGCKEWGEGREGRGGVEVVYTYINDVLLHYGGSFYFADRPHRWRTEYVDGGRKKTDDVRLSDEPFLRGDANWVLGLIKVGQRAFQTRDGVCSHFPLPLSFLLDQLIALMVK